MSVEGADEDVNDGDRFLQEPVTFTYTIIV
jgi:hypothetical protein